MVLIRDPSDVSALFFPCYLLIGRSEPDQPAHLSTTSSPPIMPPQWKADGKNRPNTSVIMPKQQQTVDSRLGWRIQRCFHPPTTTTTTPKTKLHMEAISVAVRTGTFPSPPPHSLYSFSGMLRHTIIWELIKEAALQRPSHVTWC